MSRAANLGMGVMIGLLSGNEDSVKAFNACIGKKITKLHLKDNGLHFEFKDGTKMCLYDSGQSCCESRYMTTDDKLKDYVGGKLLSATVKPAPSLPYEYGDHEIEFLDVKTSKGIFQMASHNEHNGYYGGFLIRAALE